MTGTARSRKNNEVALRLTPEDVEAHVNLGVALGKKGDWDGEIAEDRKALRLNPELAVAHFKPWRRALGKKDDSQGAAAEFREARRLKPDDPDIRKAPSYEGGGDGLSAADREVLHRNSEKRLCAL